MKIDKRDKYRIEHKKRGLCIFCPRKAVNASYCERHRKAVNKRARVYRKSLKVIHS